MLQVSQLKMTAFSDKVRIVVVGDSGNAHASRLSAVSNIIFLNNSFLVRFSVDMMRFENCFTTTCMRVF